MAESEEKLKSLLKRVKEESEKAGLKFNIQKMLEGMESGSITSWQIDRERMETVTGFIFFLNFHYSRRWIPKDHAAIYIKECSGYVFL